MHRLVRSNWSLKYTAIVIAFCTPVRTTTPNSHPAGRPTRPHITGIDYVRVYVSNIDKSRKFYSEVLGLTVECPHYTSGEICFLVRPSAQRLLLQRAPIETANRTLQNWLADIGFATDNLERMRLYLLAQGQLPSAIHKDADGREYFRVRDPEGHSIVFVQTSPSKMTYVPAAKQVGTHLLHAGFVAKDMSAENRFYVKVLGFRLSGTADSRITASIGTNSRFRTAPTGSNTCSTFLPTPTTRNLGCKITSLLVLKTFMLPPGNFASTACKASMAQRSAATAKTAWTPTIQTAHVSKLWSSPPPRNHVAIPIQPATPNHDPGPSQTMTPHCLTDMRQFLRVRAKTC